MRLGKVQVGLVVLACAWLVAGFTRPAYAQSGTMQQVGLVRTGTGTFSIDVEGADIRTIVRAISEFSGRNIVVGKDVRGVVKVALKNVGWQEALRTILRSNGLDFVEEGGILRVDDLNKLQTENVERETARAKAMELRPLDTRIIKLNYANASELSVSLTPSLSRRGSIQVERRTNSLIVSDLEENCAKIEQMASNLDSTTPQIEITAKLVDVEAEALRDLGIEWNVGGAEPAFFDNVPTPPGRSALNPNNDNNQGLAGNVNEGLPDHSIQIAYGIFKDWGSVEVQLEALEQNRKANIISNPRITTVDNREAKILVGQKIPLIVQDVAGNAVSQLQTIGIQLKVTPHLTQDKKIIMDLHPEVSALATRSTVQGGVIINTSEADTRVMVDDGQTAVIGGLIRTDESSVRRGVPIMKDIPLVGMFFRSSNNTRTNRELIIFVTPRLVENMASK
jgi:type IV pilus assembly protein PilQ